MKPTEKTKISKPLNKNKMEKIIKSQLKYKNLQRSAESPKKNQRKYLQKLHNLRKLKKSQFFF